MHLLNVSTDIKINLLRFKINQKGTKELEKDLTSKAKWSIETDLVSNTGTTNQRLAHQINCRHDINLQMNSYRFAAISPN